MKTKFLKNDKRSKIPRMYQTAPSPGKMSLFPKVSNKIFVGNLIFLIFKNEKKSRENKVKRKNNDENSIPSM